MAQTIEIDKKVKDKRGNSIRFASFSTHAGTRYLVAIFFKDYTIPNDARVYTEYCFNSYGPACDLFESLYHRYDNE